ncbi:MAG: helix-turn-helix transcriptional regulator [Lachnospiraceae bacterium]|nr:helix-turn-helix transcriptional regulator [Lachnospiraceae bacterium]
MADNKILKKNIQNLINKSGISMRKLSLAIDATPCYIQQMMVDKFDPSMDKLYAIANFFDVPVASLFIDDNALIQEIDTYLVYLDDAHLEVVLNLTKQLIATSSQK